MRLNEQYTFEMLRKLPTELSLIEVGTLVNRFPDTPPHKTPWWRKLTTWLYLLLVLLIGSLTWFFSLPPSLPTSLVDTGKKSIPPIIEKEAQREAIRQGDKRLAPSFTKAPKILPADHRLSKDTVSNRTEPAFTLSAEDTVTFSVRASQTPRSSTTRNSPVYSSQIPINIPSIKGKWSLRKNAPQICFDLRIHEKGKEWKSNWKIPICSSTEELSPAFIQGGKRFTLERASGEMVFARGIGKSGDFTFYPNTAFVTQMEKDVLAVKEIPLESLSFSGSHQQAWDGIPIYSEKPYSLLWLKFFISNIDSTYINFLREKGFEGKALTELWHLADSEVPKAYLDEILSPLSELDLDLSLEEFAKLYVAGVSPGLVKALAQIVEPGLSLDQLLGIHYQKIPIEYITELSTLGYANVEESLLTLLYAHEVDATFIRSSREKGLNLSLEDYLYIKLLGPKTRKGNKKDRPEKTSEPIAIHTFSIPSFHKLVVRGNIRVVVKEDDQDEVSLYTTKDMQKKINVKLHEGVLKVSPKPGFTPSHFFDVKITASGLRDLVSGSQAQVYSEAFFASILKQEN